MREVGKTAGLELMEDHRAEVHQAMQDALDVALNMVGIEAQGDVSLMTPVDTGLLRNSITYAVSGHEVANNSYQSNGTHASTPATRRAGTAGKPVKSVKTGRYEGGPVDSESGEKVVIIGTNVEYAP